MVAHDHDRDSVSRELASVMGLRVCLSNSSQESYSFIEGLYT